MTATRPAFTDNARTVLNKRYLQKDKDGNIAETPEEMLRRVSFGNEDYYEMMAALDFLPNSPTLFNIGTGKGTGSACFKFDVEDSMSGPDSILDVHDKAALVQKWGGGVGYVFSALRARGTPVGSTHGAACGPVAVMRHYHSLATMITQGGKRDGAQMGIMSCDHPDLQEFIHCKDDVIELESLAQQYQDSFPLLAAHLREAAMTTFNISVALTDDFMQGATEAPIDPARYLTLRDMAAGAWRTGDPGCYFIDTSERTNPAPWLGPLSGTNPCFTGDTKVWTLLGPMRFDELVGQEVSVLTQDEDDKLIFRLMSDIRLTRQQEPIYRVALKRSDRKPNAIGEIRATGDHLVFLADGSQCAVADLQPGTRLSSVYRYKANSKGYLKLQNTAGDVDMEHRIVAAWNTDERPAYPEYHVDHIDENKQNNLPSNLRVLPHAEHNALNMLGARNPVIRFPDKNIFKRGFFGAANGMYGKRNPNHTVISVEPCGFADVYDGTVDGTSRFFVVTEDDGAVLVHNCGEVPLRRDEPCNLGSINLAHMYRVDLVELDWHWLEYTVRLATRYLDDVLDHNWFPHEDITKAAMTTRKLGLGVMGLADLFALMHIHYDSDAALELSSTISQRINRWALEESWNMARDKSICPAYDYVLQGQSPEYISSVAPIGPDGLPPRNATRTCIAPTGTISLLAGASGGIEPHYSKTWTRIMGDGTPLEEIIPVLQRCGTFMPHTAMEIDWRWHVRHQAAWQANVDLAVSKTINMPEDATPSDIFDAYVMMWKLGCKGGTVYRHNSRPTQVLNDTTTSSVGQAGVRASNATEPSVLPSVAAPALPTRRRLPDEREAVIHKFTVGDQEGYLSVGLFPDGQPGELFATVSKEGSTVRGLMDTIGILTSLALQYGIPLDVLTSKLQSVTFEPNGFTKNKTIPTATSIVDYIFHWLRHRFMPHTLGVPPVQPALINEQSFINGLLCPDCGGRLIAAEGCMRCASPVCGYEKCG